MFSSGLNTKGKHSGIHVILYIYVRNKLISLGNVFISLLFILLNIIINLIQRVTKLK
jgi:hypothetical protein